MNFSVFKKKKKGFLGILGPPYCGIRAAIRIGREMLCLPYVGFFSFKLVVGCQFMLWKKKQIFSFPCHQSFCRYLCDSKLDMTNIVLAHLVLSASPLQPALDLIVYTTSFVGYAQTLTKKNPLIYNIYLFSKIPVTFEPNL